MKVKLTALALVALLIVSVIGIFGCAPTPAPVEKISLIYAAGSTSKMWQNWMGTAEPFINAVVERSRGRVEIATDFGVAATQKDMPDALRTGLVDFGFFNLSAFPAILPSFGMAALYHPVFLTRITTYENVLASRILMAAMPDLQQQFEKNGLKFLFFTSSEPTSFLFREPVTKLDDWKGKKIRYHGGEYLPKLYEAAGGTPVLLPFTEVYSALDKGIVDGAIMVPLTVRDLKWYEVGKHMFLTEFAGAFANGYGLTFGLESWNKLPSDIKRVVLEEAWRTELDYAQRMRGLVDDAYEEMKNYGMNYYRISQAEMDSWGDTLGLAIYDEFAQKVDGTGYAGTELVRQYQDMTTWSQEKLEAEYTKAWEMELAKIK